MGSGPNSTYVLQSGTPVMYQVTPKERDYKVQLDLLTQLTVWILILYIHIHMYIYTHIYNTYRKALEYNLYSIYHFLKGNKPLSHFKWWPYCCLFNSCIWHQSCQNQGLAVSSPKRAIILSWDKSFSVNVYNLNTAKQVALQS